MDYATDNQYRPSFKNFNLSAEKELLSYLLRNPSQAFAHELQPSDFLDKHHEFIYRAISKFSRDGVSPTPGKVMEMARAMSSKDPNKYAHLDALKDSYVDGLWAFVDPGADVEKLARTVRVHHIQREVAIACRSVLKAAETGYDPEKLRSLAADAMDRAFSGGLAPTVTSNYAEVTASILERANNFSHEEWRRNGFYFDIPDLDDLTDGLRGGLLIIVGAAPGGGKTAISMQATLHALERGQYVYIASLEMPKEVLINRLMSRYMKLPYAVIEKGNFNTAQMERLTRMLPDFTKLVNDRLIVQEAPHGLTVGDVKGDLFSFKAKHGFFPDVIFIDYVGLMISETKRSDEGGSEFKQISVDLRALKAQVNKPFIVFSQLNDTFNRPKEDNIAGSKQFVRDADQVWLMSTAEKEQDRTDGCSVIRIDVVKNRKGKKREILTKFDGGVQSFLPYEAPPPDSMTRSEYESLPSGNFRRAA